MRVIASLMGTPNQHCTSIEQRGNFVLRAAEGLCVIFSLRLFGELINQGRVRLQSATYILTPIQMDQMEHLP